MEERERCLGAKRRVVELKVNGRDGSGREGMEGNKSSRGREGGRDEVSLLERRTEMVS